LRQGVILTVERGALLIMGHIKDSKLYFRLRKEYYRTVVRFIRKIDPNFKQSYIGSGGTVSFRYCYSVFMRHIVSLFKNGMTDIPNRVAEFGPGSSLGTGLCAILAGAREYYALDLIECADNVHNLEILDGLTTLFKEKAPIPDNKEFPEVKPLLDDYSFPSHIFGDDILKKNLSDERVGLIKRALSGKSGAADDIVIKYIVPWEEYPGTYPDVDFIFSQAVLEHIDNLDRFYSVMNKILAVGGFVSHDIDFRSHGETYEWNGHWAIPEKKWKKIRGTRPYVINREPLSTHIRLFEENGFKIKVKIPSLGATEGKQSIKRKKLADRYVSLSDEDFETFTCFVIAQKT
jgi:SAM-dependent methyltransferase